MADEKQPMTASPAASPPRQIVLALAAPRQFGMPTQEQQKAAARQKAMAFKQKHAEFRAEAAGLAAEFGVDVNAVVFVPGGKHAFNDIFPGDAAGAAQQQAAEVREARKEVVDLLRKDAQRMMGLEEAKAHEAQLLELRSALERRLQEIKTAAASTSAAETPEKSRRWNSRDGGT